MKNMHESMEKQKADLGGAGIPDLEAVGAKMSAGADCDQIPGAQGPFGSPSNPIPVNGPIGERKYLAKLRGQTGQPVMFHRKGSNFSSTVATPVDTFEVVCMDGTQWTQLTFSPYHPRQCYGIDRKDGIGLVGCELIGPDGQPVHHIIWTVGL